MRTNNDEGRWYGHSNHAGGLIGPFFAASILFGYKPIPGTLDHYSGYFPIWKICYYITSAVKYELQKLFGWGLPFMFRAPLDDEAPWVPYERFSSMMSVMTNHVIINQRQGSINGLKD